MKMKIHGLSVIWVILLSVNASNAREYHVSISGDDKNSGTLSAPFATIGYAAKIAQPGDVILIHSGTYREYIDPAKGGKSDDNRITYRAFGDDLVYIKGSEVVNTWSQVEGPVWKVSLPPQFFGDYNPYNLTIDGDFQVYGQEYHRGEVYISNISLNERLVKDHISKDRYTWYATVDSRGETTISANFGDLDPNRELTEINVRETIFFPSRTGIDYITIDGLHFLHAAPNWQAPNVGPRDPNPVVQIGAVGSRMGKGWIIENCEVSFSKTAGIMMGETFELLDRFDDIDLFGQHIIRNNIITRCGEYGIAGQKGLSRSLIYGNLVEDINYKNEFGGWETAGIKIWNCTDVTIEYNLVRRTYSHMGAYGIWVDFANQGTRVTRNLIYDTSGDPIYLEANLGPVLVDNNILEGDGIRTGLKNHSAGVVLAHNFFVNTRMEFDFQNKPKGRHTYSVEPHTLRQTHSIPLMNIYNRIYNNIFSGADIKRKIPTNPDDGNDFANNVYLCGLSPITNAETFHRSEYCPNFEVDSTPNGVEVRFDMDATPFLANTVYINPQVVGEIPLSGQSIEDKDGNGIAVDIDFNGQKRTSEKPLPGPLNQLAKGKNTLSWKVNQSSVEVTTGSPMYQLEVKTEGKGRVNVDKGYFTVNTQFPLVAWPEEGWVFVGWKGDLASENKVLNLQMNKDFSLVARFAKYEEWVKSSRAPKAIIEAENFSSSANGFSVGDFNVFKLKDGGNALGFRFANEKLTYHTYLEKGTYLVKLNIASEDEKPGIVEVSIDGNVIGKIKLENTGGRSSYRAFSSDVFKVTSSKPKTLSLKFAENSSFFLDNIILIKH